jgi:hypothetical protein
MPGGQKEAYELVADVLEEISAKAPEDGALMLHTLVRMVLVIMLKWFTMVSSMEICN